MNWIHNVGRGRPMFVTLIGPLVIVNETERRIAILFTGSRFAALEMEIEDDTFILIVPIKWACLYLYSSTVLMQASPSHYKDMTN